MRIFFTPAASLLLMANLLLIDDDPGVLRALGLLLKAFGYQVSAFSSPREALEHLRRSTDIDLVLTDLRMPELSGEDVLRTVKSEHRLIPVIIMSGHATDSDIARLKAHGLDAFIPKPFTPDQFKLAVGGLLPSDQSAQT
jgi:CheY-like chemotaxis protein